uniref:Uncharacterized protein n=1 Tax=Meloidogyne enterolobii TaxID=390850 RepID=A0A6V7XKC8_MELEN|nr:unnamed protein product [Meloidogyne enterolobii]
MISCLNVKLHPERLGRLCQDTRLRLRKFIFICMHPGWGSGRG